MAKPNPLPSQNYLKECFDYDPDTGILRWKARPRSHFISDRIHKLWNGKWAGRSFGTPNSKGYVIIKVDGRAYKASRIIWKLMTGNDPIADVDHHNRIRSDNAWENLREADAFQQSANRRVRVDSLSGLKRAHQVTGGSNFWTSIQVHGKAIYLGVYPTAETAHQVYCEAARKYFGEFWTDGSQH